MSYTVWSRGRLIGHTDLEFIRLIDVQRSGSFHPNDEGEGVMSAVASPLPAMRAYLHRDARDAAGNGFVQPELQGSALFADLAETFHHFQALELELRRADGSVVPTADIGFQDAHHYRAVVEAELEAAEECAGDDAWQDDPSESSEADRQLEMDVLHDMEVLEGPPEDWVNEGDGSRAAEALEGAMVPRYQIHLTLLRGDSIP